MVSLVQNDSLSKFSRASKYTKEDIEVAAHDAALQIDRFELAEGNTVIDPDRALAVFKETFSINTGMSSDDFKITTFEIFDESNSSFPYVYEHPIYEVEETFQGPTVAVVVELNSSGYFDLSDKNIRKMASYTYDKDTVQLIQSLSVPSLSVIDGPITKDGLHWPVPSTSRVTSNFNPSRVHPISGEVKPHTGTDIADSGINDAPSVAMQSGTVIYSGWMGTYGNIVIINHGNGLQTRYAHLNKPLVGKGEQVDAGQPVGLIGSTGSSTNPHLHFEIRVNGKAYDPMVFFK